MDMKQYYTGIFYDGNGYTVATVTFEDATQFGPLGSVGRMTAALNEQGLEWDVIALVAVAPESGGLVAFGEAIADDKLFEPWDPEGQPVEHPMADIFFRADGSAIVQTKPPVE